MSHPCLTRSDELAALCETLAHAKAVAIDTEFIRERTYYPQLCLIQVATHDGAWAIDPLAENMDLAPLLALLANENIVKVFHAARQDLEIFHHLMGRLPSPVFDTQIAAQACGHGESVSYESLVLRALGKQLDKGARFTDWARRPLTDRQLSYALSDVIYLIKIYEKMFEGMTRDGRIAWVEEDMHRLVDPALYDSPPEDAWKRLKVNTRKAQGLAVLREMAAWREREARRMDVPRGRLVRDDLLTEIAMTMPQTMEDLMHVRGTQALSASARKALVDAAVAALAQDPSTWPVPANQERNRETANRHAVSLLQLLLEMEAERHRVTPRLIASRGELEQLALGQRNLPVLKGWRRELFGEEALKLLAGEIALSPAKSGVHIIPVDPRFRED